MAKRSKKKAVQIERLSGLRSKVDRDQALETIGRAFSRPGHLERHMVKALWRGPVFDPEHTRVAVADGRVVSAVVLAPRRIRFGPVTVPAMTVGPVGTHDHYRKQGLAARTMEDASHYMKESGFLVAYLQGIRDFYYRFGYYPFRTQLSVKFEREGARKESLRGTLRTMRKEDLPAVRSIYDKVTAGLVCSADRDETVWSWLLTRGKNTWLFASPKVILDKSNEVCGYLCMSSGNDLAIREIVVTEEEDACRSALGALVREARKREVKKISIHRVPWNDKLTLLLRQYVDAEFTVQTSPTGGPLMLILDFPALMERLQPTFSKRWREARSALGETSFTCQSEIGSVGLEVTRKGVTVGAPRSRRKVVVPQRWLSGLLTGYYSVGEVAASRGATVPATLRPVLDILFPRAWPFVFQGDDY